MNEKWYSSTNIYEVNLRQYTPEGTIISFRNHLPRLSDMGVHTLWFMPLTPIAQKHKKGTLGSYYACADYTAISSEFGSWEDWRSFVSHAHDLGFKVIIDWVANHTGWDHRWTVEHPDWYKKDAHTGDFKMASGMEDIIELDFGNSDMRKAMIDAMKFWITESDIDGFRCDLAFWVQLDFWIEAKNELQKIKNLFWLGELDVLDSPEYMEVYDAAYTWRWMHKAEQYYKQQASFPELIEVLQQYTSTSGWKAWFTSNHDENSWNGTEYEKYGEMAIPLAVFSCTFPGLPLIYSGQELPNHKRLQFFEKDVIGWSGTNTLHQFYKYLFTLRKMHPCLHAEADFQFIQAHDQLLVFKRYAGEDQLLVIINFSAHQQRIKKEDFIMGDLVLLFSEGLLANESSYTGIQPWGYAIYEIKNPAG